MQLSEVFLKTLPQGFSDIDQESQTILLKFNMANFLNTKTAIFGQPF